MMGTSDAQRLRLQAVAAEFVEQMGARIRARREDLGLSRPDLARRMPGKVSENQIYRWEAGKHQPKADTLEALAAALETQPSAFMAPVSIKDETPDPFGDPAADDLAASVEERLDRIEEQLGRLLAHFQIEEPPTSDSAGGGRRGRKYPRGPRPPAPSTTTETPDEAETPQEEAG